MIPAHISASLDRLAMDGVLDYDAYSYLNGSKPRYIGNPKLEPLPPTAYGNDEYVNSNSNKPEKSAGKKILTAIGVALAGVGIFLGIKNFSAIKNWIKNFNFKNINFKNIDLKGKFNNTITGAKDFIKNIDIKGRLRNLFKKKP